MFKNLRDKKRATVLNVAYKIICKNLVLEDMRSYNVTYFATLIISITKQFLSVLSFSSQQFYTQTW